MKIHNLKILPRWFDDVKNHKKNFEVRKNDRDYHIGDILLLCEFKDGSYTGRKVERTVCYIYHGNGDYGIENGFCILGLQKARLKNIT